MERRCGFFFFIFSTAGVGKSGKKKHVELICHVQFMMPTHNSLSISVAEREQVTGTGRSKFKFHLLATHLTSFEGLVTFFLKPHNHFGAS